MSIVKEPPLTSPLSIDNEPSANLTGHLKSPDFFGVEKNPTATLVLKSVTPKAGTEFDVKADLTIKGKTNEVTFPATITVTKEDVKVVANFKIDRTKFDIKYGSGSFFENLGDKAIENDFNVEVNVVAIKEAKASKAVKMDKAAKAGK